MSFAFMMHLWDFYVAYRRNVHGVRIGRYADE